ncbi:MAG: pyridoxal phosphate-dependent aminotransferase [Anaerolineae bacterium]|nr:pyridoxal phosphate-dependent aminotransferase [Anaerolineae bacterium]
MTITDYLAWARHMSDDLRHRPDVSDLFNSAVHPALDWLDADLERAYATDFADRLAERAAWGHPRLLDRLAQLYGIPQRERILTTSGASMAYVVACQALVRPGDRVIVERPYYQPFVNVPQALGADVRFLDRPGDGYGIDLDTLADLLTPGTALVALTNPHNPSGMIVSDETLRQVGALAHARGAYAVVDEVYADLLPGERRPVALLDDGLISIGGLSKVYGMGRLRIGWLVAAPEVMTKLRAAHVVFDNSSSAIIEAMATVLFDRLPDYRARAQEIVTVNRPLAEAFLAEMAAVGALAGDVPTYGCTMFPRVAGVDDTDPLVTELYEQPGVLVVPGRFFGGPGHVRIGFGRPHEQLQTGLARLAGALPQLR